MVTKAYIYSAVAASIFTLGLYFGYKIYGEKPQTNVTTLTSSPEKKIGNSTQLASTPMTPNNVKINTDVPKGFTPTRTITIKIHDTVTIPGAIIKVHDGDTEVHCPDVQCPDTRVNLTIGNDKDHRSVVIAASPDGTVVNSIDIPIIRETIIAKEWAVGAGINYDVIDKSPFINAYIMKDVGMFRLGGMLTGWNNTASVGVNAGIKF